MNLRDIDWTDLFLQGILWLAGGFCASCAALLVYSAVVEAPRDRAREAALFAECLADGHKEYQCVAMLRRPDLGGGVVPIVIPMPMRR